MQALLTRTEVDGRIELVGVGAMTGAVALMGIVGVALRIYARTLRNCIATWCLCSLRRHVEEACRLRVLRLITAIPRVRMHSCLDLRPGLCRLKRGVKGLTGKTGPGLKIVPHLHVAKLFFIPGCVLALGLTDNVEGVLSIEGGLAGA